MIEHFDQGTNTWNNVLRSLALFNSITWNICLTSLKETLVIIMLMHLQRRCR